MNKNKFPIENMSCEHCKPPTGSLMEAAQVGEWAHSLVTPCANGVSLMLDALMAIRLMVLAAH